MSVRTNQPAPLLGLRRRRNLSSTAVLIARVVAVVVLARVLHQKAALTYPINGCYPHLLRGLLSRV